MTRLNLSRPFSEELHRAGLPYLGPREGFSRYGLPNSHLRPTAPLRALFLPHHPDVATVYVDDDRGGVPVAVVRA